MSREYRRSPEFLQNTMPKALMDKLGPDRMQRLCLNSDYRDRAVTHRRCSCCRSWNIRFNSTTRTVVCKDCGAVVPAVARCG